MKNHAEKGETAVVAQNLMRCVCVTSFLLEANLETDRQTDILWSVCLVGDITESLKTFVMHYIQAEKEKGGERLKVEVFFP